MSDTAIEPLKDATACCGAETKGDRGERHLYMSVPCSAIREPSASLLGIEQSGTLLGSSSKSAHHFGAVTSF